MPVNDIIYYQPELDLKSQQDSQHLNLKIHQMFEERTQLAQSVPSQNQSPPPRSDTAIEPCFNTPKKIYQKLGQDEMECQDFGSPRSNNENLFTPVLKKHTLNLEQHLANQSTQAQLQSPFSQSPNLNWKTPQSLLKTNPFVGFSGHSTPNTLNKNHTPISPYSDRYIPFRQENLSRNLFQVEKRAILPFDEGVSQSNLSRSIHQSMEEEEKVQRKQMYQSLLQETLLSIKGETKEGETNQTVLSFKSKASQENSSQKFVLSSEKKLKAHPQKRKIETAPFKVLDAPGLMDDFYQDVLHWSKTNLIAVGLNQAIYLYNFVDGKRANDYNYYTSLQWNSSGNLLGIGTFDGMMMLWDAGRQRNVSKNRLCTKRIAAMHWANNNVFACGTKERSILIGDIRVPNLVVQRWLGAHQAEVCGLAFSDNELQIASGGNDNKVHIWSLNGGLQGARSPDQNEYNKNYLQWSMKDHKAAVRALSWNPNATGVLATGGGSADKTIKISNTLTNTILHSIEVDSQVCKLMFSRNTNEIVSAHGYERHQIMVWQYPQPKRICTLEGHSQRVLYMSFSPDDQVLVTGSGDETLKFWNIFPKEQPQQKPGLLNISDFR